MLGYALTMDEFKRLQWIMTFTAALSTSGVFTLGDLHPLILRGVQIDVTGALPARSSLVLNS